MNRHLSALLFLFGVICNTPNATAIPLRLGSETQSLYTAFDCVNIATGDYFETHDDVFVRGPYPLRFTHCLECGVGITQSSWKGVNQFLQIPMHACTTPAGFLAVNQREGAFLACRILSSNQAEVSPEIYKWGYTNYGSGDLSGRSNLRNTRITFPENNKMHVQFGSGLIREYSNSYRDSTNSVHMWLLNRERHPDGHRVHFSYDIENHEAVLKEVKTTNAAENLTFNSFTVSRDANKLGYTVNASNGQSAHYQLEEVVSYVESRVKCPIRKRITFWLARPAHPLKRVQRSHGPATHYSEDNVVEFGYQNPNPRWMHTTRNTGENGNYRCIDYHGNGSVSRLQAPLGTDSNPITYARFEYTPQGTEVYDAYNNKTFYRLTGEKRVAAIERYVSSNGQQQLYSSQQFRWGDNGTLCGNLITRGIADPQGRFFNCAVGSYDDRGNVIKEELFGNLTGLSPHQFNLSNAHRPVEQTECYAIETTYSDDGFNLPLKEMHGDGKVVRYAYEPQSSRLISTLTGDEHRIYLREFRKYNADGLVVEIIQDDGSGQSSDDLTDVTTRTMKRIQPRRVGPAIGLPDAVVEMYWDRATSSCRQLKRTQYRYNSSDLLEEETVYDADDQIRYSLQYVYDEKSNLVAKSDCLGRVTRWTYDQNKNKLSEELVGGGSKTLFRYDQANRLVASEVIHDDGERLSVAYRYDYLGHKVAEIDAYGNETTIDYDDLGRELATRLPKQVTDKGVESAVIRKSYNALDQLVAVTDANGNCTRTEYNMRDQPTLVTAPDGSQQRREYNLNGTLKTVTDPNGLMTRHEYDVLGRLIQQQKCDPSGNILTTCTNEYYRSQLIRTTDAAGIVTEYSYDGAGRKISETCQDARTEYIYDAMGRVHATKRWFGSGSNDYVATIEERDLLDRVVESRVESSEGVCLRKQTRAYDILDNCTHVYNFVSEERTNLMQTCYNSRKLPIKQIDALGHVTTTSYDMQYRNALGQRVLLKIVTDPFGKRTCFAHDAAGRCVTEWSDSASGVRLAQADHTYDLMGNRTQRTDSVMAEGAVLRKQITRWTYDTCNRLTSLVEACGTTEERITRRVYNRVGQLETIYLPGGISLRHHYDAMARLSDYSSSDNTIAYHYSYDTVNNLIAVEDTVNASTTRRQYDGRHRVTEEMLANGLTLRFRYDPLDRMTWAQLPDQSSITWIYDAVNLCEVQRWTSSGTLNYCHIYGDYDQLGHPLEETLLGYAGSVRRSYDALGRQISYQSDIYQESIPDGAYDAVGNLLQRDITDALGPVSNRYQYDALYRLTQEDGFCHHRYQQDSLHNRLAKNNRLSTLNALNALIDSGSQRYSYDAQGLPTQCVSVDGTTHYRYDAIGRLLEVQNETGKQTYQYDSFHRRTHVDDKRMLYIGQNEIGVVDAYDSVTELRLLGNGRGAEIGASVAIELYGYVYAVHHDSSGNVVALVNRLGYVSESYRYSAYGEEQISNFWGQQIKESRLGNAWRFSSKRTDELSGLVYFGRRYYHAENGRWLTPDPLGYDVGPNLYGYVNNNPLTHIDQYGLFALPTFDCLPSKATMREWGLNIASVVAPVQAQSCRLAYHALEYLERNTRATGSHDFIHEGRRVPGVRFLYCCGIDNPLDDCKLGAKHISESLGGVEVHVVYNSTDKHFDLLRVARMSMGFDTDAVDVMTDVLLRSYREASAESSTLILCPFVHSQGTSVLDHSAKRIPPEIHKAMHIQAFGGTTMIKGEGFGSVKNTVSTHDWCSMLACPIVSVSSFAYAALGSTNPNVHYVEGSGFYDHGFMGDTYKKVVREYGDKFIEAGFNGENR